MKLTKEFLTQYDNILPPFGPVGEVTYKRTYARKLDVDDSVKEHWGETQARVVNSLQELSNYTMTMEEMEEMYDHNYMLRSTISGRGLWQLGTETVKELGGASLNACWHVPMDSLTSFTFIFDMMMLGGGVGLNIQREYVYQLPKLKAEPPKVVHGEGFGDADFIVPDTREGWIQLLWQVLNHYFDDGNQLGYLPNKTTFTYSTAAVRRKGAPIKGFGGVASGPQALIDGITNICKVLDNRVGKRLRPIDVLDVSDIIGSIVVAGNVRRAAIIILGDTDDFQFLDAKRWDLGNIPNWRAMSNNTVVCNDFDHLRKRFWEGYEGNGEPYGLMNLALCRTRGRLLDPPMDDNLVTGTNPCGEISLEPFESCNLAECFAPNIQDEAQLTQVLLSMYRMTKIVSSLPLHWPQAAEVLERNRRLGLSITGIMQATDLLTEKALDNAYHAVREYDVEFSKRLSKQLGREIKPSLKISCVKPSGTVSLLAGVSAGVHPELADQYIRRIRMSSSDPLVAKCADAGYDVEYARRFDGTDDRDTKIVSFPVKSRGGPIAADVSAIQQLEMASRMQRFWSDNQVSCTAYYTPEELPAIKEWMHENYTNGLKGISFLLKSEHGFDQAPIEPITEEIYTELMSKLSFLDLSEDTNEDMLDIDGCATGACPIR